MIYLQMDHEFRSMLIRVIWAGKHEYDEDEHHLITDDYKILIGFDDNSAGGNPEVWEIMDGYMGNNDELWPDNQAFKYLFDRAFSTERWDVLNFKDE